MRPALFVECIVRYLTKLEVANIYACICYMPFSTATKAVQLGINHCCLQMYHASRESFLYLQEFYIGELVVADKAHVPLGGRQPPSEDFMVQLSEYTGFRQPLLQQLEHSTPATHLGARRV